MACDLKFNTGNPLCSDDLKDLTDNAILMDQYINSAEFEVTDRLGNRRLTWAGMKLTGGIKGYETKGDLPADSVAGDVAIVMNDGGNNGYYRYDGVTWIYSEYNPFDDDSITFKSRERLPSNSNILTDNLSPGSYVIRAANITTISGLPEDIDGTTSWFLDVFKPVGENYGFSRLRLTSFNNGKIQLGGNYNKIVYDGYLSVDGQFITWNNTTHEVNPISKDFYDSYKFRDSYINKFGELVSSRLGNRSTDFINISNCDNIEVYGYSTNDASLIAFYDFNKKHISSVIGHDFQYKEITIDSENFPDGSFYIRSTAGPNESNYLKIVNQDYVLNNFDDINCKIQNISGVLRKGRYWRLPVGFIESDKHYYTDYIKVKEGDKFLYGGSITSNKNVQHPIFDKYKRYIGNFDTESPNFVVTRDMITKGVEYVAFSYRSTDDLTLLLERGQITVESIDNTNINSLSITGIFLTGASFSYPGNSWFAKAVTKLKINGYNKAISGTGQPLLYAEKLWRGTLFTEDEFENFELFAMNYASQRDLDDITDLKNSADEYTKDFDLSNTSNPFSIYSDAQRLDYILKRYRDLCYEKRLDPNSRWYGTKHGKPCLFMFITPWHDFRPYNSDAIRNVAKRWGAYVCELDKKIGFSKNQPMSNGVQVSTLYAVDTQVIDGITYGWHPLRGEDGNYIQTKIASIFANSVKEIF